MLLIVEPEVENEQGKQEVGEEGADSPLSQPEPVGEISAGLHTKTSCFVCLLLSFGDDIHSYSWLGFKHSCVIRVNGKVQLQQSASHQTGVLHILLNDSLT